MNPYLTIKGLLTEYVNAIKREWAEGTEAKRQAREAKRVARLKEWLNAQGL